MTFDFQSFAQGSLTAGSLDDALYARVRELEVMLEVTATRLIYVANGGTLKPDELETAVAEVRRVLMASP